MAQTKAVVVLQGPVVHGVVRFAQASNASLVSVTGHLTGLSPENTYSLRICLFGDLSETGFTNLGGTYNPYGRPFAGRFETERATGYLDVVSVASDGSAKFEWMDPQVSLFGPLSILARSLAVVDHGPAASSATSSGAAAAVAGSRGPTETAEQTPAVGAGRDESAGSASTSTAQGIQDGQGAIVAAGVIGIAAFAAVST